MSATGAGEQRTPLDLNYHAVARSVFVHERHSLCAVGELAHGQTVAGKLQRGHPPAMPLSGGNSIVRDGTREWQPKRRVAMLILSRRTGEGVVIGSDITVTVLGIKGNQVRLGIRAPEDVAVNRTEIHERIERESDSGDEGRTVERESSE